MKYLVHTIAVNDIFLDTDPHTLFRSDFLESGKCKWLQDRCIDLEIQSRSALGLVVFSVQAYMNQAQATEYFLRFDP